MIKLLSRGRNFTAAVLETVGSLVVVLSRDGRIVCFNQACQQATGYSSNEIVGK